MKNIIKLLSVFVTIILFATSCRKDDDNAPTNNNPTTAGFKWKENDPNGVEKTAASARFQGGNTIIAQDTSNQTLFEINLMKGSTPGTYNFDGDYIKGVALYYTTASFNATSGTITITDKTASKISGTFEAHGTGTSITKIYGTFTDIPVQ